MYPFITINSSSYQGGRKTRMNIKIRLLTYNLDLPTYADDYIRTACKFEAGRNIPGYKMLLPFLASLRHLLLTADNFPYETSSARILFRGLIPRPMDRLLHS